MINIAFQTNQKRADYSYSLRSNDYLFWGGNKGKSVFLPFTKTNYR